MEAKETKQEMTKETSRIESFSDGVFAIAITLLILDIHIPDVKDNQSLLGAVFAQWPSFLGLLIGFFTILICWINHHYMFQLVHKSDSPLLLFNGFKLLMVTVAPISTALLAKQIGTANQGAAVSIYCFNFALMGVSMSCLWCYACWKGLAKASPEVLQSARKLYIFAGVFSTSIWLVSFTSFWASLALSAVMFIIFIFPKWTVAWLVNRRVRDKSFSTSPLEEEG